MILILKDGKQHLVGSYDEIVAQGFDVDEILNTYHKALSTEGEANKTPGTAVVKLARKVTYRKTLTTEAESIKQKQQSKQQNLVEEKEVNYGPVTWADIRNFLQHSAGVFGFSIYMLISILVAVLQLASSYVLSIWAKQDF